MPKVPLTGLGYAFEFLLLGLLLVCPASVIGQVTLSKQPNLKKNSIFQMTGKIKAVQINESSGLAISSRHDSTLWTANDSGHEPTLFHLDRSGEILASVTIGNAKNVDWEAMANLTIAGTPHLLIADTGDNLRRRKTYQLYLLPEPDGPPEKEPNRKTPAPTTAQAMRIEFTFADGPRNCEAVSVDPLTNEVWLAEKVYFETKRNQPPGIYRLRIPAAGGAQLSAAQLSAAQPSAAQPSAAQPSAAQRSAAQPLVAQRIGSYPVRNITGMTFSPDGKYLVLRTYFSAHLFVRRQEEIADGLPSEKFETKNEPANKEVSWLEILNQGQSIPVAVPLQRQGEAIVFSADSKFLFVTSELPNQPIWKIDLLEYLRQYEADQQKD